MVCVCTLHACIQTQHTHTYMHAHKKHVCTNIRIIHIHTHCMITGKNGVLAPWQGVARNWDLMWSTLNSKDLPKARILCISVGL